MLDPMMTTLAISMRHNLHSTLWLRPSRFVGTGEDTAKDVGREFPKQDN